MRLGGEQHEAGLGPLQSRFRVDLQDSLQGVAEEAPEIAELTIAVPELSGQLRPGHGAGFAEMEEPVHEPGVDVEVHRALAQLADRGRRQGCRAFENGLKQDRRQNQRAALPYSVGFIPPEPSFLGEQCLANVQAGATGGIADVFIDRDGAMDQSQELVGVNPEGASMMGAPRPP